MTVNKGAKNDKTGIQEQKHRNTQFPKRIVVERVYLGGQSMEDAFRKINEETVKENIEKMMKSV